ncbi:MAG: carboxymuconolactone decarboxylase family protein [Planctomycetota bacterium]
MPRLNVIEPDTASSKVKELYEDAQQEFGNVFNLFKGLANAPGALEAYITLERLIAAGKLSPAEQETVRLTASQFNGCEYCLAAHSMTASMKGLSNEEILAIRRGEPSDPKLAALVQFTRRVLETKGSVRDDEIQAVRAAGYTDEHMSEVVTILAQKTLSNYFNHIHQTPLDIPAAAKL